MVRFLFFFIFLFSNCSFGFNSCEQLFPTFRTGFFIGDPDTAIAINPEDIGGPKARKVFRLYSNNPNEQAAVLEFLSVRYPHFHKFLLNFIEPGTSILKITTRKLLDVVDAKIAEWVADHQISRSLAIRPGVIYHPGHRSRIIVPMDQVFEGEPPPREYNIHSYETQIADIARSLFAVSNGEFTLHDLAHIEIFLRDPKYTWTMVHYSIRFINGDFNNLQEIVRNRIWSGPKNWRIANAFEHRYSLIMENLTLFTQPVSLADLKDIDSLIRYYDKNAIHWGAAANDSHIPNKRGAVCDPSDNMIAPFGERIRAMFDSLKLLPPTEENTKMRSILFESLKRWILVANKNPDPVEWIKWAFAPEFSEQITSDMKRYYPKNDFFEDSKN